MQTQHANTTCTHTTHMSHTKQTPWQTPMCDSSETCTTRVGNVANGQFVLRLVTDPNNGGLRGLSWILGSVNRACVVLWLHLGVRQPARGLLVSRGNNRGRRGSSWISGSSTVGLAWSWGTTEACVVSRGSWGPSTVHALCGPVPGPTQSWSCPDSSAALHHHAT